MQCHFIDAITLTNNKAIELLLFLEVSLHSYKQSSKSINLIKLVFDSIALTKIFYCYEFRIYVVVYHSQDKSYNLDIDNLFAFIAIIRDSNQ